MSFDDEHIPAKRNRLKGIETYEVFSDDFDRIEDEASRVGTDLQFATASIPVSITLAVTLSTVTIQNERLFNAFLLVALVSLGLGLYCGVRGWRQRGRLKKFMQRIRDHQVGPLGEEGKELRPSELSRLPGQEPGPVPAGIQPAVEPAPSEESASVPEKVEVGDRL